MVQKIAVPKELLVRHDEDVLVIFLEQLFFAGIFFERVAVTQLPQGLLGFLELNVDLRLIGAQLVELAVLAQQREDIDVVQEQVVHQENGERQDVLVPKRLQILFHDNKGKRCDQVQERWNGKDMLRGMWTNEKSPLETGFLSVKVLCFDGCRNRILIDDLIVFRSEFFIVLVPLGDFTEERFRFVGLLRGNVAVGCLHHALFQQLAVGFAPVVDR